MLRFCKGLGLGFILGLCDKEMLRGFRALGLRGLPSRGSNYVRLVI